MFLQLCIAFEPKVSLTKQDIPASEYLYIDDSPYIISLRGGKVSRSEDDGITWKSVKGIDSEILIIQRDSLNFHLYAFTSGKVQFYSEDQGASWKSFKLDVDSLPNPPTIILKKDNPKLKIIEFLLCKDGLFLSECKNQVYYTENTFKSLKKLPIDAVGCTFFQRNDDSNTMFCIEDKLNSVGHVVESRLLRSNDFFKTLKLMNPDLVNSGRIVDVRFVLGFLTAVVQNDKFNSKSKITILLSKTGEEFYPADLKSDVSYGSLSFLESSRLSIFISVTPFYNSFSTNQLSTVYASDLSGQRFTEIAKNVLSDNFVKVETIDGVWISNIADEKNQDSDSESDDDDHSLLDLLIGGGISKNIESRISFNDGKDWQPLKVVNDDQCKDDCSLHLLSPSTYDGEGKYVTGPTPGILMGIGNTGKKLTGKYSEMKTYISRDGGATWEFAIDEPCLFAFGDLGNIIVAVPLSESSDGITKKIFYSIDQGLTWELMELEQGFFPVSLTTTIDGTGTNFLISGVDDLGLQSKMTEISYSLSFSGAYDKKCGDKDFEQIYARVTSDEKEPLCLYGHREKFKRRKADAKCFAASLYKDVTVYDEACECNESDFECSFGFKLEKNACVPDKSAIAHLCKGGKKEIELQDKHMVDGTQCLVKGKKYEDFMTRHKFKCSDFTSDDKDSKNKEIVVHKTDFEGKMVSYSYFRQGDDFLGENLIVRTDKDRVFASKTGGWEFVKAPIYEKIYLHLMGPIPGQAVLVTGTNLLLYSIDFGLTYKKVKLPGSLVPSTPLVSFSQNSTSTFIVYVTGESDSISAYYTKDDGASFEKLRDDASKCEFVGWLPGLQTNDVFCTVNNKKTQQTDLISITENFSEVKTVAEHVIGFATSGSYVVVGKIDEKENNLDALVTVDGTTFAAASFPRDLNIDIDQAFTVLDAESGSIFIHVTTESAKDSELGSILKSNSNGTSYSLTLNNVNRNSMGYVDYDRIEGMEGTIISNVVSNYQNMKQGKQLKTMISHSDGGQWEYITPPQTDSHKKKYKCSGKSISSCSLNLHGFTEREDYRDTFYSESAVGVMVATGNVGPYLTEKKDASTFLTTDGGFTWKEIKSEPYMWEFGDRGSILVLVKPGKTNKVIFSLNNGKSWSEFKFNEEEINVVDIATVPSDNSRKFVVFAEEGGDTVAFSIDFTGAYLRQCQLDLDKPDKDDFEYWTPKTISNDKDSTCLFGHEAKYLRRVPSHDDCFIGQAPLKDGFKIVRNCSCSRDDYECDYNYFLTGDNTCKLVKGLSPSDHEKEMCKNNAFQFFEPTGYRKIPLSTCEGGKRFDSFIPHACPGKLKEFNEFYGTDVGFGKLLLILGIPLAVFIFATWFVYDRGIRRNGGFKQFGQIRLDDEEFDFHPIENNEVDKAVNTVVRGGIYSVAVLIAAVKTLRKFDKLLFDKITSQIFRGRGRRNYVSVPDIDVDEEDELFGNFQDNYNEELEHGDEEDFQHQFTDNIEEDNSPFDDDPPAIESDSRLFDIDDEDDQSSQNDLGARKNDN